MKKIEILKNKVFEKFENLKKIAAEKFIYVNPSIVFDLDSSTMIGCYKTKSNTIHLNEKLLEEFGEAYIDEVLIHEFAHVVTWAKYGPTVRDHGKEWKKIAKTLGLKNPTAKSKLPIDESKYFKTKNRFVYKCDCSEFNLSTRMHNNIQKRGKRYFCKNCGQELKFVK